MDAFRYLLAAACCLLGFYLVFDLFAHGFSFLTLLVLLGAFVAAWLLKPRHGDTDEDDILTLETLADAPFRLLASGLRALGRTLRGEPLDFD